MTLHCFAVFHLNLAFSSIEEEQRPTVMDRCYWPLLDLVRQHRVPIGIEAPGSTLEMAEAIDPEWVNVLRALVRNGQVEFIGSGYAQLIGPLVPADVVRANLRLGHAVYERLLGVRPTVALVHEQAWSASLVSHYRDAGYGAVIMEWENPRATHEEWPAEWRYHPQRALGTDGASIPVLWNHSIAFQKLQRYAHGEIETEEYLEYLRGHYGAGDRVLAIYGSDAEVFDYRPGRYRTEAALSALGEWQRLNALFTVLGAEPGLAPITPSAALGLINGPDAGHDVRLETARHPVPVKKQPKYDLARWAVTGRDDLGINTACWRIAEALIARGGDDSEWRELCYLWSSDFRTHITASRWDAYIARLAALDARHRRPRVLRSAQPLPAEVTVRREGRYLTVDTETVGVRLNCRRGLAIDALTFPHLSPLALCGSVPHGYFDRIDWSADQYTGFLVLAAAGQHQVTDLEPAEPVVTWDEATDRVIVSACVGTPLGRIEKTIAVGRADARVEVRYRLDWPEIPLGTLRLGHVTLIPTSFDAGSLFYATHNGGTTLERFALDGEVDHVQPVSHLVSCRGGVGATGGVILLGDAQRAVQIEIDRQAAALFPLITMHRIGDRYLCRVTLSARELDDTSRLGRSRFVDELAFAISGRERAAAL